MRLEGTRRALRGKAEAPEAMVIDDTPEARAASPEDAAVERVDTHEAKRAKTAAKDEGWEDLDKDDIDDPLMVAEYVEEIFEYMRKIEMRCMPNGDYMSMQRDISWHLRGVLVD